MAIQQIKIVPNYPNQQVGIVANGQNITLNLYFRGFINQPAATQEFINTYAPPSFYADIFLANAPIIQGTPVIDRIPINLYPSKLKGSIVSIDSQGNSNPTLENLGQTVFLYYVDDLEEINNIVSLII